jgi:hypothetical protein
MLSFLGESKGEPSGQSPFPCGAPAAFSHLEHSVPHTFAIAKLTSRI